MKNVKLLMKKHGLESNEAIRAAEIMADAISDDVLKILNTYSREPIHERIAKYFNFKRKEES
jgi:16S rRNA C1402 N4-methylase RsmH